MWYDASVIILQFNRRMEMVGVKVEVHVCLKRQSGSLAENYLFASIRTCFGRVLGGFSSAIFQLMNIWNSLCKAKVPNQWL